MHGSRLSWATGVWWWLTCRRAYGWASGGSSRETGSAWSSRGSIARVDGSRTAHVDDLSLMVNERSRVSREGLRLMSQRSSLRQCRGEAHRCRDHEGTSVSQAPLRAVQDHPPKGRGPDHLHQPEAQAEAGLISTSNRERRTGEISRGRWAGKGTEGTVWRASPV